MVSVQWSFSIYLFYQIDYIEQTMSTTFMDADFSRIGNNDFTTSYKYNSEEQEFIFCCKGKPFATLVTSNIPTPSSLPT